MAHDAEPSTISGGSRLSPLLAALAVMAGAAGLGACGADEKPTTEGPAEATYTSTTALPASDVRDGDCPKRNRSPIVRGKDVRVAGQDGRPKRRPRKLEVAREITLSCLRWSNWGRSEARAKGISRELDCKPNCAAGNVTERRASLVVTGLERCMGRRFYSRARLVYASGESAGAGLKVFTVVPCPT